MLPLPPNDVDSFVESSWPQWAQSEVLGVSLITKLVAAIAEVTSNNRDFPFADDVLSGNDSSTIDRKHSAAKPIEHESGSPGNSHSRSGILCKCGQIHIRRGDRVQRGPKQLDNEEVDALVGQLGTIVRVGKDQESVNVKWDRSVSGKVNHYVWPDPDGLVLAPASFTDVADDVIKLRERTGLSSAAAEECLRRTGFDAVKAAKLCGATPENHGEADLRNPPMLFHRVRILPDSLLVQQWFDNCLPCRCNRPACHGGLQWSSRADNHLGREAIVLKIDTDDDTVQVQTCGRCSCQIWYPRLAVEPVYDPDLEDTPLFDVNDAVECKMADGWKRGVVHDVTWRGANRRGPCPYAVLLHDGEHILVPHVDLIRKAR